MESNFSIFKSNVTINQVIEYLNLSHIAIEKLNITNDSEVSEIQLFDLYEAYKTKEREELTAYSFVSYILGTLIILSNLVVVVSSGLILRKGQQPKSTYLLLGNVSLADTIIGISLIFGATVDNSMSSDPLCIFQIGMLVCPTMVSIFSVGLIAVDRYIYIIHGLYYQRWFNTTRVRIGIVCIWIVGIFISFLPAMGWTGETFRDYRCWYIAVFPPSLLIIVSIVVLIVIILVCVLYVCILRSAVKTVDKIREFKESTSNIAYVNRAYEDECKKMSKTTVTITVSTETVMQEDSLEMHELSKTNIQEKRCHNRLRQQFSNNSRYFSQTKAINSSPSKLKAVKTVLLVTLCFVGTWAPYYVAVIIYVKCDIMVHGYDCIPLEILTLGPLYLLGVCNSLFDPLIYAWRHSGFKRSLRRIYLKYACKTKM